MRKKMYLLTVRIFCYYIYVINNFNETRDTIMSIKKIGLSVCSAVLAASLMTPVDASAILLGNKADPTDANSRAVVKMQKIVNEKTSDGISRAKIEMCSGVLIAPQWILTTGTCALNFDPNSGGGFTQSSTITIGPDLETAEEVTPIESHSAITEKGLDFGLVKLKEEAKTTPVKLSTVDKELDRETLVDLYGWGASMIENVNDEGKAVETREKVDTNKAELSDPMWFKEKLGYRNQTTENFPNSNIQMLGVAKAVEGDQGGPAFYDGSVYAILSIGYPTDPEFWSEENDVMYDKFNSGKGMIAPIYAAHDWIESTTGIDIEKNNKVIDEKVAGKSFEFKKDDGSQDKKTDYYYLDDLFGIDPEIALIPYKESENTIPKGNPVKESDLSDVEDTSNTEESGSSSKDTNTEGTSEKENSAENSTPNEDSTNNSTGGNTNNENTSSEKEQVEKSSSDEKGNPANDDSRGEYPTSFPSSDDEKEKSSDEISRNSQKHKNIEEDNKDIAPTDNIYKNRSKDNDEKTSDSVSTEKESSEKSAKIVSSKPSYNDSSSDVKDAQKENVISGSFGNYQQNIQNSMTSPSYSSGPVIDTGGAVDNIWKKIIGYFK